MQCPPLPPPPGGTHRVRPILSDRDSVQTFVLLSRRTALQPASRAFTSGLDRTGEHCFGDVEGELLLVRADGTSRRVSAARDAASSTTGGSGAVSNETPTSTWSWTSTVWRAGPPLLPATGTAPGPTVAGAATAAASGMAAEAGTSNTRYAPPPPPGAAGMMTTAGTVNEDSATASAGLSGHPERYGRQRTASLAPALSRSFCVSSCVAPNRPRLAIAAGPGLRRVAFAGLLRYFANLLSRSGARTLRVVDFFNRNRPADEAITMAVRGRQRCSARGGRCGEAPSRSHVLLD